MEMGRDLPERERVTEMSAASSQAGHTAQGTSWGCLSAGIYAATRHGPDGAQFLDPYFLPLVRSVAGMAVVDIGCGAGPWAVEAGLHSAARVEALDIQQPMVDLAQAAVREKGLTDRVNLTLGDAAKLQFPDGHFDRAFSINVGCNLPAESFARHFQEMYRVLKPGGVAVVTAPANLDVVFSDGQVGTEELHRSIQSDLASIGFTSDSAAVLPVLSRMQGVYRATFYPTDQGVALLRPSECLDPGTPIWRKIPGQGVPNRYHREDEYEVSAKEAGFEIEIGYAARFATQAEYSRYHGQNGVAALGSEYIDHNPFLVLILKKPS